MRLIRRVVLGSFGTLMPRTAARTIGRHMMKPYSVPAIRATIKATEAKTEIPYAHGWLNVSTWGEGPTIMLLHGWGGRGSNLGGFVDPLIAAGFKVVAHDAPAHGGSDGEITSMIECGGAVLQVGRSIGPVFGVIGHSFGAPCAAFAVKHGLQIDAAVFLGAPLSVMDLMKEIGMSRGVPSRVCDLMVTEFEKRYRFGRGEIDTDNLVENLRVPLLVVHDETDKVAPLSDGETIASCAPNGVFMKTNGLGHRGVLSDSDVIERSVDFLTTAKRTSSSLVTAKNA